MNDFQMYELGRKEQSNQKDNKALRISGVIWYKFLPYLPIVGIPLTWIYHNKFGNTGIEDNTTSWITAFIQAISVFGLFLYAI